LKVIKLRQTLKAFYGYYTFIFLFILPPENNTENKFWRHNIQHNNTEDKDIEHYVIEDNNIQHNIEFNDAQHYDIENNDTRHSNIEFNGAQHNDIEYKNSLHNNVEHNNTSSTLILYWQDRVTQDSIRMTFYRMLPTLLLF